MNARDLGLLLLRVALASVMFTHGAQKMLGWWDGPGIAGFVGWMGSVGVPAPLAWLALLVEFVGGIAVLLGIFTRLFALGFAGNMVVATVMMHWPNGFFMNWGSQPDRGEGWEFTFVLMLVSLAVALLGPGRLAAIDRER